jgi:hypothetical protein
MGKGEVMIIVGALLEYGANVDTENQVYHSRNNKSVVVEEHSQCPRFLGVISFLIKYNSLFTTTRFFLSRSEIRLYGWLLSSTALEKKLLLFYKKRTIDFL